VLGQHPSSLVTRRRAALAAIAGAAAATGMAVAGCTRRSALLDGSVAVPERALPYAPLLLAVREGLYRRPPARVAMVVRSSARDAAAAVVDGEASAAALPLIDFAQAVAAGAPLVAISALTRRAAAQLVVATSGPLAGSGLDALLAGRWRAARVGVQTGGGGTERLARYLLLDSGRPEPEGATGTLLASDLFQGEPRWIAFGTDEALVAAIKDYRLDAFFGRSLATAQAVLLGGVEIAASFSDGATAPRVASLGAVVLATRRDWLDSSDAAGHSGSVAFLADLVAACRQAASTLSGADQLAAAAQALPEIDRLALAAALRLDAPSPQTSAFAPDGRLDPATLDYLATLTARAGQRLMLDPSIALDYRLLRTA